MDKIITKTSTQAQLERKVAKEQATCPSCGRISIGLVAQKTTGFFNTKTQKNYMYSCYWCGCEWQTGWH